MKQNSLFILFFILIVIAAAFGAFYFKDKIMPATTGTVDASPSGYQAVFLDTNQVYFGKLSDAGAQFPTLRDVYYLQVNQALQPTQGKDGKTTQQQVPDISLIKFGGELHGPTDAMRLNRDHILMVEDLRADSNVIRAIKDYMANAEKQAAPKQ